MRVRKWGALWEARVSENRGSLPSLMALSRPLRCSLRRAEAEVCFRVAIDTARTQFARLPERRASLSLARLLRDTTRRDEGRAILAQVYNWFTEGFDTADLKDAKALLDELRGSS